MFEDIERIEDALRHIRSDLDLIDDMPLWKLIKTFDKMAELCDAALLAVERIKDEYEPTEVQQGLIPIPDGYAEQ